jgi:hypothetical protein
MQHRHDRCGGNTVPVRDRLPDRLENGLEVLFAFLSSQFERNHERLPAGNLNANRGTERTFERRMALGQRDFDILGEMIDAVDNHDVFDPADNKELPTAEKTEIAGPQELSLPRAPRAKYFPSALRLISIP